MKTDCVFVPQHISDVKVGDMILLRWDGYEGVPKYLGNTWAEVIEIKRKRVVVKPTSISGTQTIRFQQIARVSRNG